MRLAAPPSKVMNSRRFMTAPGSGADIVSAQTSTLIEAETGFDTAAMLGAADVRYGSLADIVPVQLRCPLYPQ